MINSKDTVLDSMNFELDDTCKVENEGILKNILDSIDKLNNKVDVLLERLPDAGHVGKSVGRKKCIMLYNNQEISNDELRELSKTKSVAEILRDFTYISEDGVLVVPNESKESKVRCRSMINNRLRWYL